jgi:hypothetical protein
MRSSKRTPGISRTRSPDAFETNSWDRGFSTEASTKKLERKMKRSCSSSVSAHARTNLETSDDGFATASWHGCPDASTKKSDSSMKQTRRSGSTRSNHERTLETWGDAFADATSWGGPAADASTKSSETSKNQRRRTSSTRSTQEPPLDTSQQAGFEASTCGGGSAELSSKEPRKQLRRSSSTRSNHERTLAISYDGFADAVWGGTPEPSSIISGSSKKASRRSSTTAINSPSEVNAYGFPASSWHGYPEPPTKPDTSKNTSRRSSTTTVKGRPVSTDERSSSEASKRRSSSFDEDLLSSKALSAAFAPKKTAPDTPLLAVTKVETSKVSLDDSFSPGTTDSTTKKKDNTNTRSSCTERRGNRGRSNSRGRRNRTFEIEEKPDEEVRSKEDIPSKPRARSSSRGGGRRSDSASDLGMADPSSGENATGRGRRSSSGGRRRTSSKDPGKRHATEENTKQNPVRVRSNSRGRRRASLVSMEDSVRSADPTQTSRVRSTSLDVIRRNASSNKINVTSSSRSFSGGPINQSSRRRGSSLDVIRRNAANNPLGSSKSLSGQSLSDGMKHVSSSVILHSHLEAKSWGSLQKSFNTLDTSESGRGGGSRSGRASRRMPKGMAEQDKSMDSSLDEATKSLSETKAQASCGFLSVDLRERFRSDFPGAKDMPTDDELKERYRNTQFTAPQTTPSEATETGTSEPKKDSEDEEQEGALDTTTHKPKKNYSDKLMAATKGKPASFTMMSKARRKSQTLSENTLDPFKTEPIKEPEGAHAIPKLDTPRRGPGLKTLVKSVSMKFSLKNSTIDKNTINSDDGSVKSSSSTWKKMNQKEEAKEVGKMMKKGKKDDAQPEGDDSLFPSTVAPKGAKPSRGPAGTLFKMTSILKFDNNVDWGAKSETKEPIINQAKEIAVVEDVWIEPSADSKGKNDKHDSSRRRSGSRPRSSREKECDTALKKDTKKKQDMFGDSTTTGADSIRAKANKKSKGAVRHFSTSSFKDGTISSNDDVSRRQPASSKKIRFLSRNSITNDMPDNDNDSCENAAITLASARSRRTSTKTSGSARESKLEDMLPVLKERKVRYLFTFVFRLSTTVATLQVGRYTTSVGV